MTNELCIDETILKLNEAIEKTLALYVRSYQPDLKIRFELFEKLEEAPTEPTLLVFLYDIYEDLEMRQAQTRQRSDDGTLMPRTVNIRCRYLISYWVSASAQGNQNPNAIGPKSQTIQVMNRVLNALLNAQTLKNSVFKDVPQLFARVVPPSEQLNSLGNFWQSLGNKPRLCLTYEVTVPVCVGMDNPPDDYPVTQIKTTLNVPSHIEAQAEQYFSTRIGKLFSDANTRRLLGKILVKCRTAVNNDRTESIQVMVFGQVPTSLVTDLIEEFKKWIEPGATEALPFTVLGVNYDELIFVSSSIEAQAEQYFSARIGALCSDADRRRLLEKIRVKCHAVANDEGEEGIKGIGVMVLGQAPANLGNKLKAEFNKWRKLESIEKLSVPVLKVNDGELWWLR